VQSFLSLISLPGNGLQYFNCLPTRSRKSLRRPDLQFGRPLPIEAAHRITGALAAGVRVFSAAWVGHYVACEDMRRPSAFSSAGTVASGQQYSCTALARSSFVIARSSRRRPSDGGSQSGAVRPQRRQLFGLDQFDLFGKTIAVERHQGIVAGIE
jgi:hypothetical protein